MKKFISFILLCTFLLIPISSYAATKSYTKLDIMINGKSAIGYVVDGTVCVSWSNLLRGYDVYYNKYYSLFYIPGRPKNTKQGYLIELYKDNLIKYEFSKAMVDDLFFNIVTNGIDYANETYYYTWTNSYNFRFVYPNRGTFVKGKIINGNTYIAWNTYRDRSSVVKYKGKYYFYYK